MNKVPTSFSVSTMLLLLISGITSAYSQRPGYEAPQVNVASNINTKVEAEPLDARVNSSFNEYGPLPTKDGKRLYFSRAEHPENTGGIEDEDIWYSEYEEATQSWTVAKNIGAPLNNDGPNFVTGIGIHGDTLLLANVYRKNGKITSGVSVSVLTGGAWSFPVPVNIEADYNLARRATYDVSHDRKVMIISEHKADSQGNLDLYVSFREQGRKHPYAGTESINLGNVVNTAADETCGWLSYDGLTLYFASDGHDGYGKMDLFRSVRLDDTWTNWSVPENLGPGINSRYDELSFNFNPLDRYAYFTRSLSVQNSNIFRIDMTYLFLDNEDIAAQRSTTKQPGEVGQTKVVRSVFTNAQSTINKESLAELALIVSYLKRNNSVEMSIRAHSPRHATREESSTLSIERAKKVLEYLVENGIERKRLICQGFGHDVVGNDRSARTTDAPLNVIAGSVEFKIIKF